MATTGMSQEEASSALGLSALPEGCVADVISQTSPRDAGRLTLVSRVFKSAAESDAVWERFLPRDYRAFVPESHCRGSKKELYLRLSDDPILIDQGRKSFWLDKQSGKKCYMLSARELVIVWGDTPRYWKWIPLAESRFPEVAELIAVCWLEIRGKISISMLSSMTRYKAYLVFKKTSVAFGLGYRNAEVTIGLAGTEGRKQTVYLELENLTYQAPPGRFSLFFHGPVQGLQASLPLGESADKYPQERKDKWLEIELGEFFNEGGEDGELEMSLLHIKGGNWKNGLIVEGIEIRAMAEDE